MNRNRGLFLLVAVFLGLGAALLLFWILTLPPVALAQTSADPSAAPTAATAPALTRSPQAPARPLPAPADPRTLTTPAWWRLPAGPPAAALAAAPAAGRGVEAEVYEVGFWLDPYQPDWIWGVADPGAVVTITTPHAQIVVPADPDSGEWIIPEQTDVQPGDTVTVTAEPGLSPVTIVIPSPITSQVDSDLDQVWGQIGGRVEEWVEVYGWWDDMQQTVTDADGYFEVTFDDVPRGGEGHIRFGDTIDDTDVFVLQPFRTSDLMLRVNYGHEWVEGNYEAGHAIWITLTDSLGDVKATASGETGPIYWWGDEPGFATGYNVLWHGSQPDIEPGDWAFAALDNGKTTAVRIGTIEGELNIDTDIVSGTVHAPWFAEPLNANCGVWVEDGIGFDFVVDPDGGTYLCDFGAEGWDLLPGQTVGVQYQEPDGDWVINVFEEPVPRVSVQMWANGQPAEGGNFAFRIEYVNEGGAPAEDVVITDTMQSFAYLDDTSGLPFTTGVTPGGDPYVVWEVGTLDPGDWTGFDLFVEVTGALGDPARNTTQIATSNPFNNSDPWQLESVWEGEVVENDTHLNVGKGAWTWNPAPGYDFIYNVNICNNGSTGSTPVTVTDTLPLSTTLQYWWGQEAGWQEVDSGPHHLVVERPTMSPWSCSEIYLRVTLDEAAWPGMELINTAVISAANDLESDDNEATLQHHVSLPYTDLSINQAWYGGMLVPGGHLRYHIHINNQGNLPVEGAVRVTDTLPAGTSFSDWGSWGWVDIELVAVNQEQVIWEITGLDNGYYASIELGLDIDPDVVPGTLLVNQAEVAVQPDETDVENNHSVWEEWVYDHGPNLRVRKDGDWHGHGEGHNAWYQLQVENVGDESVYDVTVTDHYPAEMELDGGVNAGYWQWWDWAHDPDNHVFTVTLEVLEPSWSVGIDFNTVIPGEDPILFGLTFTNAADVGPMEGDTHPADNYAARTLFTGPDFYIEKDLAAGVFLPGEVITYHLRFGNDQVGHAWWWNPAGEAWITDTLPAGMSYVAAYQRWCGAEVPEWCERDPDEIDGQELRWQGYWLGGDNWNELLVVAQITDTLGGLDTFTNWAAIGSDLPDEDIEPYYDNNVSVHIGELAFTYLYLPVLAK